MTKYSRHPREFDAKHFFLSYHNDSFAFKFAALVALLANVERCNECELFKKHNLYRSVTKATVGLGRSADIVTPSNMEFFAVNVSKQKFVV